MNTRSDYTTHRELAEGARNKVAPLFTPDFRAARAEPIPAWLWLLTLAPWVFVAAEVIG